MKRKKRAYGIKRSTAQKDRLYDKLLSESIMKEIGEEPIIHPDIIKLVDNKLNTIKTANSRLKHEISIALNMINTLSKIKSISNKKEEKVNEDFDEDVLVWESSNDVSGPEHLENMRFIAAVRDNNRLSLTCGNQKPYVDFKVCNCTLDIRTIKATLSDNKFENCVFSSVKFVGLSMQRIDFINCQFIDCVFEINHNSCIFHNGIITDTKFSNCIFKGSPYSDNVIIDTVRIYNTKFIGCGCVDQLVFERCEMSDINIKNFKTNVKFDNCSIINLNVDEIDVVNALITFVDTTVNRSNIGDDRSDFEERVLVSNAVVVIAGGCEFPSNNIVIYSDIYIDADKQTKVPSFIHSNSNVFLASRFGLDLSEYFRPHMEFEKRVRNSTILMVNNIPVGDHNFQTSGIKEIKKVIFAHTKGESIGIKDNK